MRPCLPLVLLLSPLFAGAQDAPPGTDVFLLELAELGTATNISARPGYDNQPAFAPDGKTIYFTSQRGHQTDIYGYDVDDAGGTSLTQITDTVESEYSPTPVPGINALSVVRVEQDGKQLLWCLDLAGGDAKLLLPNIEPVGYHSWASAQQLALFVLGDTMTLQAAKVGADAGQVIASDIGRGIQRLPDGRIAFIQIVDQQRATISAANLQSHQIEVLIDTRPGSQDFAVSSDGTILMAQNNQLFGWHPRQDDWQLLASFEQPGLQKISRIAVSPDGSLLALVGDE